MAFSLFVSDWDEEKKYLQYHGSNVITFLTFIVCY